MHSPPAAAQDTGNWQPVRRVPPRVHTGELVSTLGALVLLVSMLALDWYGAVGPAGVQRSGITTAQTAWHTLGLLRWLMLLTILLALASTVLHATQRRHGNRTETATPVAVAAWVTAGLLGYRVLIAPPRPREIVDVKLGAWLGVLSALAVALGALQSRREERERRLRPMTPAPRRFPAGARSGR